MYSVYCMCISVLIMSCFPHVLVCIHVAACEVVYLVCTDRCFRVYIESEFWYPHTVEELVVWTIERQRGKWDYIRLSRDRHHAIMGLYSQTRKVSM